MTWRNWTSSEILFSCTVGQWCWFTECVYLVYYIWLPTAVHLTATGVIDNKDFLKVTYSTFNTFANKFNAFILRHPSNQNEIIKYDPNETVKLVNFAHSIEPSYVLSSTICSACLITSYFNGQFNMDQGGAVSNQELRFSFWVRSKLGDWGPFLLWQT